MGYTGGALPQPTYEVLGDHSEAIEIAYDPARITYAELLEEFWAAHQPAPEAWSRQYRSAIFTEDPEEHRLAEKSKRAAERRLGRSVHTTIEEPGTFWQAESYHQKHRLRSHQTVLKDLLAMYPEVDDLVRSTAAARLNAWVAGYGDDAEVREALDELGLSEEARGALLRAR